MGEVLASSAFELEGNRCHAALFALSAELDGNTGWAHLASLGEWRGHRSGAFEFTPETFASILANFDRRKTPIKFDYEHQTLRVKTPGPIPASGHIKQLELRANGTELWGRVEWTPKAAEMIRSGEYTNCSAVIDFEAKDRRTGQPIGPELIQAALTDDPFIDGLHALQLTRFSMSEDEKKAAADKEAADKAKAEEDAKKAALSADAPPSDKPADKPADAVAASDEPPPVADDVEPDAVAAIDILAQALNADKASVIQSLMDNADAIVAVLQKKLNGDQMTAMLSAQAALETEKRASAIEIKRKDATIVALTARITEFEGNVVSEEDKAKQEADAKLAKAKARVAELTAKGHIDEADEDQADAVFLFTSEPERAERVYGEPKCPVGKTQAGANASGKPKEERATVVSLDSLETSLERMSVAAMVGTGTINETDAIKKVIASRAERN